MHTAISLHAPTKRQAIEYVIKSDCAGHGYSDDVTESACKMALSLLDRRVSPAMSISEAMRLARKDNNTEQYVSRQILTQMGGLS